jgi:hypothetical protein
MKINGRVFCDSAATPGEPGMAEKRELLGNKQNSYRLCYER